ncbi:MAG: hypothetical protein ACI39H_09060 [Lachnospiraceae bacterium]
MQGLHNRKKIFFDMGLNMVATAIPVFVLQLFILPLLSSHMSSDNYGLVVTVLSLFNVVSSTMGNTLNNIRLIKGAQCEKEYNFNIILIILAGTNFIIIFIFSFFYYGDLSYFSLLLNIIVATLWLFKEYYIVGFRIKLNYLNIVKSNLILTCGYVVGYGIFLITDYWQCIYISGLLSCFVFISTKVKFWKEPLEINKDFKGLLWQTILLLISSVLYRVPTYADKLIIYPILGGTCVSIFYVATLFGKIVSMVITPVSGVILSYLSKTKKKDGKSFSTVFVISIVVGVVGYFLCLLISRPLLGIIYPDYIENAMKYIPITTGTVVITALITIVDPFVLRFFDMKWQVFINACYVVFYLLISLIFLQLWNLLGFCVGALVTSILKLTLEVFIFYKGHSTSEMLN